MHTSINAIFPTFERELVEAMEQHCEWKHFRAGEELTRTGQYFRSTMLIAEGLVKVYREDDQGNEFFLYYLQPGDACALSMVCAMKAEASQVKAVAVKDSEILSVPIQQTDAWMSRFKSWNQFVVETFRSRFEELLQTVDHIAFRAMDERLEFYLKRNQQTLQTNIIEISHQQIADDLNSSREVISRLLKKMEQRGQLRLQRNSIELV